MRQTILEEVDDQLGLAYQGSKARPYRWIGALTTYGVLLPDVDRVWSAWWSLDTVGRSIAAVQYISCLIYPENENPVFAPWTPNGGGGPPCLWGFEGHLYTHRWLEPNVTFLKGALNVPGVTEVLSRPNVGVCLVAAVVAAAVLAPAAPSVHDSAEQPHPGTAAQQIGFAWPVPGERLLVAREPGPPQELLAELGLQIGPGLAAGPI